MELCSSGFSIRVTILSPAEVDEDNKDKDDKEGGHTTAEAGPIELEPRCPCRLVNDLVTVGLTLVGVLVCRLTFGSAHVVAAVFFSARSFRGADRVKGPLGCCKPVDFVRSLEHCLDY